MYFRKPHIRKVIPGRSIVLAKPNSTRVYGIREHNLKKAFKSFYLKDIGFCGAKKCIDTNTKMYFYDILNEQ